MKRPVLCNDIIVGGTGNISIKCKGMLHWIGNALTMLRCELFA